MRIQFYFAIIIVVLIALNGCAYTGCNESHFEGLPGCPIKPVKLEGCRVHA